MENNLMQLVDVCEKENATYHKTDENLDRAGYLEDLGFKHLSNEIIKQVEHKDRLSRITDYGYLKITKANIQKFLDKKAELYNTEHVEKKTGKHTVDDVGYMAVDLAQTLETIGSMFGGSQLVRHYRVDPYSGIMLTPNRLDQFAERILPPETLSAKTCDYSKSGSDTIGQYKWEEERIENYKSIPPSDVLETLREHKERGLFDYFTIASVRGIPDPLLLGRLNESEDRYFIAQWGSDIALEDVI